MPKNTPNAKGLIVLCGAAGLLACLTFAACGGRPETPNTPQAAFDEGRGIFYRAVAEEVDARTQAASLSTAERQKIKDLEKVYPRLYGILVNYFYQKEAPVLKALLDEGSPESMRRFHEKYRKLAKFAAHMFVECLFQPSSHGAFFKNLIPRFRGKDAVDIAALSTGHEAKMTLPEGRVEPKTLSPEFDKQWGLDAARFREAHLKTRGRGARVAVLDSGIDVTHPIFRNTTMGPHFNFVGRDIMPWAPGGPPMVDWGWHGTVVSSIVARYAPEAQLTLYRECDADSMNDSPYPLLVTSIMGAAIYKAVHDGNDVINISAGSNLHVPYLEEACRYAYENNVIVVTGSPYYLGKYLGQNEDYPGQYPTNIAVTAIARLAENKYGYWDAAAPDVMTLVGSPDAPFVAYPSYVGEKDDYAPGISCATPIVASLVALIESVYPRTGTEAPGQYVDMVKKILTETANPKALGYAGYAPECGYGLIDAEKSVEMAARLQAQRTAPKPAAPPDPSAAPAETDRTFLAGSADFYTELRLALGLHPQRCRLLPSEIARIERGPEGIPGLYENVINILYWKESRTLAEFRAKGDTAAFETDYRALCREAADRFVESLFQESPDTAAKLAGAAWAGRGRLDLVLASMGYWSQASHDAGMTAARMVQDIRSALALTHFPEAQGKIRAQGMKVTIIDSGCDVSSGILQSAKFNHEFDASLFGRSVAPWNPARGSIADIAGRGTLMAAIVAASAPDAELRVSRIAADPANPYEYWPAMQLAQALYKCAAEGTDVTVTGAAFSRDFPFLKDACQFAYFHNVTIIVPSGSLRAQTGAVRTFYPAEYNSVLTAAGVELSAAGHPRPWAGSAASNATAFAAPASFGGTEPSNAFAAAACGGLAALVTARIPRTGKELPGQYVQRIAEVMKYSADSKILGFASFHPQFGYGLIDALAAVGSEAETYIKRMTQIDENFNKRMAERARQMEEAAKKEAEAKRR